MAGPSNPVIDRPSTVASVPPSVRPTTSSPRLPPLKLHPASRLGRGVERGRTDQLGQRGVGVDHRRAVDLEADLVEVAGVGLGDRGAEGALGHVLATDLHRVAGVADLVARILVVGITGAVHDEVGADLDLGLGRLEATGSPVSSS